MWPAGKILFVIVQLLSHVQFYDPMDCSLPGSSVPHYLPEFAQIHVHWVGDAIQPSHPLSSPSPPAFNLSQYQGIFQWAGSSHQVAKVMELQLQRQFFQWIFRVDSLRIDWFDFRYPNTLSLYLFLQTECEVIWGFLWESSIIRWSIS